MALPHLSRSGAARACASGSITSRPISSCLRSAPLAFSQRGCLRLQLPASQSRVCRRFSGMATLDAVQEGYVSAEDEDFVLDAAAAARDDALDAAEGGLAREEGGGSFMARRRKARRKYARQMKELQNHAEAAMADVDGLWAALEAPSAPRSAMLALPDAASWRQEPHPVARRKRPRASTDAVLEAASRPSHRLRGHGRAAARKVRAAAERKLRRHWRHSPRCPSLHRPLLPSSTAGPRVGCAWTQGLSGAWLGRQLLQLQRQPRHALAKTA